MSCQVQMGLLVLRACGQPAMSACSGCGLPLCGMHAAAGQCPNCMVASGQGNHNDWARETAARNQYYETYGGPAQFGDVGYFNDDDREALRPGAAGLMPAAGATDDYDPFDT